MTDAERLRYIAGNIEQDQREHSARYLREIADRLELSTGILTSLINDEGLVICMRPDQKRRIRQYLTKGTP